jgi:hypothetical protein
MKHISLENNERSALARLFSPQILRDFACKGVSPTFNAIAKETDILFDSHAVKTLADVFDRAYKLLCHKKYRHEYIYKNVIAQRLLLGVHSLNTASMLTEFRVGNSKADVVILNGTSTVYEIKSERDTLFRLNRQLADYLTVFDRVNVVAGENHTEELLAEIPPQVGIFIISDKNYMSVVREPKSNLGNIIPGQVFESLQRKEYVSILTSNDIVMPDVPNTKIYTVAKSLFEKLSPEQAHLGLVTSLRRYRSPILLQDFIHAVPESLKASAVSVSLNQRQRVRLLDILATDVTTILQRA